jgi:hypothetical protein
VIDTPVRFYNNLNETHMAATRYTGAKSPTSGLQIQLVRSGHLSAKQAEELHAQSSKKNIPFIDVLLQSGIINDEKLAVFCATTFGYPLLDLNTFNPIFISKKIAETPLMQNQYGGDFRSDKYTNARPDQIPGPNGD